MQELIEQLTGKLGIDASVADAGVKKAMSLLKDQAGGDLFDKIGQVLPGAAEAAEAGAQQESDGGGGLLGSLAGAASNMLGGSAGDAFDFGAALKGVGVEPGQMGGFVGTIIEFLKDKLDGDVLDQILEQVPVLKNLMD